MEKIKGTGIVPQTTFGTLHYYKKAGGAIEKRPVAEGEQEVKRYFAAKEKAVTQLGELYQKALTDVGEAEAMIFEIHQMMLEDDDYNEDITSQIVTKNVNAEYAVSQTKEQFANLFAGMDDEYMKGRAADVRDISDRIIDILQGNVQTLNFEQPVIIVAEDLTPSETILMDKDKVLAFVTTGGSKSSHTAILARMLGIPAIVGMDHTIENYHGHEAIVDGEAGVVYVNPDPDTTKAMKEKQVAQREKAKLLLTLKGKESMTTDGRKVKIYANIGDVSDVDMVLENDAEGIGLFRSEFLYLQTSTYPTEEEQFVAYKAVVEKMGGKKVIIRTLDIGADKQIDYFDLPKEENPALGMRAVRICLTRPEIFKTQLRALYRASVFGHLAIMVPMIISVEEVKEVQAIAKDVRDELKAEGISMAERVELGIMIETPASVMISDLLAKEVDFFSIGTNDLTGYTLAIDRQNLSLARFDNPHHEALLRMIKMTADNAHAHGKWIGICGELAADTSLTDFFMEVGIDELSVSPPYVLPLREKVRSI